MARSTFKKVITSPELIEKINPVNKKLVRRFLKNFDTRRSDASTKVYTSNFNIFFCWNVIYNDNKSFLDIKKSEMMDFFDFTLTDLKWGSARYSNEWSSLNQLALFIENILDDDYPDYKNVVKKIEKVPKNPVREKTILKDIQVENLLEHLATDLPNGQEACLFALAIYSGARISELFRFDIDIVDENNVEYDGLFIETSKRIKTKGQGKTGELKHKYILKEPFLPHYNRWLKEREEIMKKNNQSHNKLFIKPDGTPATVSTARSWIKKWEKYLVLEEPSNVDHKEVNIYMHCLRHYLCSKLTRIGLEAELIIDIFGWKSAEMYSIYNDNTSKDQKWKGLEKLKLTIESN